VAQNRVTPFGAIEDLPGRGLFMGNRGILHQGRTIRRRWASTAWITCVLSYKGWRAARWQPGHYTPLFFLDEATALAAGHRPCALCRRGDFNRFRAAFGGTLARDVDGTLHRERTGERPTVSRGDLVDGAMVALDDRAWLVRDGALHAWSMNGYGEQRRVPSSAVLLTPPSTVVALRRGYRPVIAGVDRWQN
jgi:hypothetical protein